MEKELGVIIKTKTKQQLLPEELRKYYKSCSVPHITVSIGEVDGIKGKSVNTSKLDFKPLNKPVKIKGKLGYFILGKGMSMNKENIQKTNKSRN